MSVDNRDLEKETYEHEHIDTTAKSGASESSDPDHGFTLAEQRRIIRRIDARLVVTVGAMYCVSLMDRTNMSNANIAGMAYELLLVNNKYQIASLVFFVPYILFQPPSTVLIRKLGPRIHLSVITLLWGGVMTGMGFVESFEQLTVCRVLLGLLEAGFFPSCVYLLSTWYTRYEVGKRYSVFYLLGCVASAFAGILAYGLMQMNGLSNLSGWRWIFIMEGIITMVLGIAGYWLLVDFPESKRKSWNFLSDHEKAWVVDRVNRDRGDVKAPPFNFIKFLRPASDWKVWAFAMLFFCTTTMAYALAYFLPIILMEELGFSVAEAQCLAAPPYALAGILMFATAWLGDKYHIRGPIIIINMLVAIIGLPILGFHTNSNIRYFGSFLFTAGVNSNIPAVMSYQANNIRGQWKRALCSATMVGFGGIGGIAGVLVFRDQDKATGYKPGMWACITCCLVNILLVGLLTLDFKRLNAKADRGEVELEADDEDAAPGFRYTY